MGDIVVLLPHPAPTAEFRGHHSSQSKQQLDKRRFSRPTHLSQQQPNSDQGRHWQNRSHAPRKPANRAFGSGLPMGLDPAEAAQSRENEAPSRTVGDNLDNAAMMSCNRDSSQKLVNSNTLKNRGRVTFPQQGSRSRLVPALEVEAPAAESQRMHARQRNGANRRGDSRHMLGDQFIGVRVPPTLGATPTSSNAGVAPAPNWFFALDSEDDRKSRKFHEDAERAVADVVQISLRSQLRGGAAHLGAALQEVYQGSAAALSGSSSSIAIVEAI